MELSLLPSNSSEITDIPKRDKLILVGLYLSKFDHQGLVKLGLDTFLEAYNVFGFALNAKPASIKNYRDEFDPFFPNQRKGWHKRQPRDYCLAVLNRYKDLDFDSFTGLVRSFFGYDKDIADDPVPSDTPSQLTSSFAQRLITGLAAEHYFESVYSSLAQFSGYRAENTTLLGCGYDFRLLNETRDVNFLAIEVKGLRDQSGSLTMTTKEYEVASTLRDRFYLFVVKNFREAPSHTLFQDPLSSSLNFKKVERVIVQTSWLTRIQ